MRSRHGSGELLEEQGQFMVLFGIASIGLVLGALVYLTDRVPGHASLVPVVSWLVGCKMFGTLGGWLPSFAHTLAFSLFTAALLRERSLPRYGACIGWFFVNSAFELGQHPLISERLAEWLQGGTDGTYWMRPIARYFARGTFDPGDIIAALLGALLAAAVLRAVHRQMKENHVD